MSKIKVFWGKYKEIFLYLLFGVLTTLVNFASYIAFDKILGTKLYLLTNAIAWILSVIFAFITNKLFVFCGTGWRVCTVVKEGTEFLCARVFSFVIEESGLWLFVDIFGFGKWSVYPFGTEVGGDMIAKIILAVIVVVMNYFFSKFVIFKKKNSTRAK